VVLVTANARHAARNHRAHVVVVRRAERSSSSSSSSNEESSENATDDSPVPSTPDAVPSSQSAEDIGAAIRAAKEAKADEGVNIFAGAAEEVGLIEWPSVGGALSTTALVMVGIFGSAGVLLGVNKVLSELSQRFFP
jgi:preprotein translocase subunit SecE